VTAKQISTQCSRLTASPAVSELLNCWPETVPVFLRHRMASIGCPMPRFETIEVAVAVYGLDRDSLEGELQQIVPNKEVVE
jgi:hybrid cluster-associated redox disulfide protein